MTTLTFIRHAEAEGNVYRRAHGQTDTNLTPNGKAQLPLLEAFSRTLQLDFLYHSDLRRTTDTAAAVARGGGLPMIPHAGLREIHIGDWEDLPWGEIERTQHAELQIFNKGPGFQAPNGESHETVLARVNAAVQELIAKHPGKHIGIVSHGCAIRYFLAQFAPETPHLDNASASTVTFDNGVFTLIESGRNDYLGDKSTFAQQTWWKPGAKRDRELWFRPVDLTTESAALNRRVTEAYRCGSGRTDAFDPELFCRSSRVAATTDPRALQFVMHDDDDIGLFAERPEGIFLPNALHIGIFYLDEPFRHQGLGIQLIGEAVSVARVRGVAAVTLRVHLENESGMVFYRKHGFEELGTEDNVYGHVMRMAMAIDR